MIATSNLDRLVRWLFTDTNYPHFAQRRAGYIQLAMLYELGTPWVKNRSRRAIQALLNNGLYTVQTALTKDLGLAKGIGPATEAFIKERLACLI